MDEDTSALVEAEAQEDKTAEPHHLTSDVSEFSAHKQKEHTETLEDKTGETDDTVDSNQLDHSNGKTNDIDPALLQSDEPKSKVIVCDCINCTLWHGNLSDTW